MVVKSTKISRADRLHELKNKIRNVGIDRMKSHRELGEEFGVSQQQIYKDIQKIISEIDPRELDEFFTNFYQTDLRALEVIKIILVSGADADRVKAINALMSLQKGATELLEAFAKKQKMPDKMEHQIKQVIVNIIKPAEEEIYEIKESKAEKPKTKKSKGGGNGKN